MWAYFFVSFNSFVNSKPSLFPRIEISIKISSISFFFSTSYASSAESAKNNLNCLRRILLITFWLIGSSSTTNIIVSFFVTIGFTGSTFLTTSISLFSGILPLLNFILNVVPSPFILSTDKTALLSSTNFFVKASPNPTPSYDLP